MHARAMPKKRKIRKSVKSKPFRRYLSPPVLPPTPSFFSLSLSSQRHLTPNFLHPFHSAHKYLTHLRAQNPIRLTRSSFLNIHTKSVKLEASWDLLTPNAVPNSIHTPSFLLQYQKPDDCFSCSIYFSKKLGYESCFDSTLAIVKKRS